MKARAFVQTGDLENVWVPGMMPTKLQPAQFTVSLQHHVNRMLCNFPSHALSLISLSPSPSLSLFYAHSPNVLEDNIILYFSGEILNHSAYCFDANVAIFLFNFSFYLLHLSSPTGPKRFTLGRTWASRASLAVNTRRFNEIK